MRRVTMSPSVPGLTPRRVRIGTLTPRSEPRFRPGSADSGDGPVGAGLEGALGQVKEHKRITERVGHLHYPADRDVLRPGRRGPAERLQPTGRLVGRVDQEVSLQARPFGLEHEFAVTEPQPGLGGVPPLQLEPETVAVKTQPRVEVRYRHLHAVDLPQQRVHAQTGLSPRSGRPCAGSTLTRLCAAITR